MKLKHLFFALAAALPLFFSCENREKPLLPTVKVEPAFVNLEAGASVQTVSIQAGRGWVVYAKPDWVDAVNPEAGAASENGETVTFSVKSNAGNDREGYIVFSTGLARAAFKIKQKGEAGELTPGSGTKEDPYSVAGVLAYLNTLGNNVQSPVVYIKGVVSNITESYAASGTNGNATFYIKDTSDATEDFYCYRLKYLGNKKFTSGKEDIKAGDQVIICGKVTNYSGSAGKVTPETVANEAYLYSLNGTSEEGQEQTEITAATVAQFIASDGNTYYRLTGKVSSFQTGHNNTGNYDYMQFNLTDDTGTVVVYGFKDRDASYTQWSTVIKDGGTVVLTGTYEKYTDKNNNIKHEVMNTTIESFTEGQAQTEITDATVAEFIQKADEATYYRLTGVVSSFSKGTTSAGKNYMQFNLTDNTGTVLVYGFKDGQYDTWNAQIKDGGTVVLTGTYKLYGSGASAKHEVMNATIESFTEGQEQTEFEEISISEFISKADVITYYRLSGKVSDFETHESSGKTYMTFNISDVTGASIYVYSFADGQIDEWKDKISDGGDVVLRGVYGYYAAESKHEVLKATIESFTADPNYKYCRVSATEIKVKADATSAKFNITANADWTLTTRPGDAIRVSPSSGSGDAEVTATFSANADETAGRSLVIVLACEAASVNQTITITQAKAGAAGTVTVEKVIADMGWTNSTKYTQLKMDDVITATASGTDSNTGKFYTNGNEWRFYQTGAAKLTISASGGHTLVSATITYTSQNTGIFTYSGATVASDTEVALSGSSAEFAVGNSGTATNGQARVTKIVVVYE